MSSIRLLQLPPTTPFLSKKETKGQIFENFLGRSLDKTFPKKECRFFKLFWKMPLEEFEKTFQRRF